MQRFFFSLWLLAALFLPSACITEDVPDNTPRGNFDALWQVLDRRYCFFPEKSEQFGLDWDSVYAKYLPQAVAVQNNVQLFNVCANMLAELRDGHVNLTAAHDVGRYWKWFEDYPANYSDSLERIYMGTDYKIAASLRYRVFSDKIGYVRCASFENGFGDGNLNEVLRSMVLCKGLIIDVRNNGGGLVSTAEQLASPFVTEKTRVGYLAHKTGPGHTSLSTPKKIYLEPFQGIRWLRPVVVLTNRRCYSAANNFVMYMRSLPQVTILGDRTGGGAGMPFNSELPNGWSVRFSACPFYDRDGVCTESGIDPDVHVDITSEDYNNGIDTIIEAARALIHRLVPDQTGGEALPAN